MHTKNLGESCTFGRNERAFGHFLVSLSMSKCLVGGFSASVKNVLRKQRESCENEQSEINKREIKGKSPYAFGFVSHQVGAYKASTFTHFSFAPFNIYFLFFVWESSSLDYIKWKNTTEFMALLTSLNQGTFQFQLVFLNGDLSVIHLTKCTLAFSLKMGKPSMFLKLFLKSGWYSSCFCCSSALLYPMSMSIDSPIFYSHSLSVRALQSKGAN